MKVIILAAGEGNRLRPLTSDRPKCLVDLFGKPILEWQLDLFKKHNISDISVVTGYRKELITYPDITYFENPNYSTTNMVETLFCAKEKLYDSVIVSYGDIIFQPNVLEKLLSSEEDFSVIVDEDWEKYWNIRTSDPLTDVESLILENGYIKNIGQKVSSLEQIQGQYIGLMKFQNDGLEFLKTFYQTAKNESFMGNMLNPNLPFEKSYMTDLLQGLIDSGCNLKAIPIKNGWLELDSFSDYEIYNKKFLDNTISEFFDIDSNKL